MGNRDACLPASNHYTERVLSISPDGQPIVESICGRCVLYEYSGRFVDIKMCLSCRYFEGALDSGVCLNEENRCSPPTEG